MEAGGHELVEQSREVTTGAVFVVEPEPVVDVIAGGSVTLRVWEAELAVSPVVALLAVTLSAATGWPVPV
jgi:hypothetical protein